MTTLEVSLIGLIAVIVGVIIEKIWSGGKYEKMRQQLETMADKFSTRLNDVKSEFRSIHERCHDACRAARISKEHELETQLKELTSQLRTTLKVIEDRQHEVFNVLREQKQISANHFSKLDRLIGMLERNGFFKGKGKAVEGD